MSSIKFGTDGWRGVIADDFTFANARTVAHAIARYVVRNEDARKGVLIGYDHRYAADRVAAAAAEVISASGTPSGWRTGPVPRQQFPIWYEIAGPPAVSWSPPATILIAGTELSTKPAMAAVLFPQSSHKSKKSSKSCWRRVCRPCRHAGI